MVIFNFLGVKERQELSAEDFGNPALRLFPILTQEDVDKAPKRVLPLADLDATKARIMAIALRKGFVLPAEWQTEEVKEETKEVEHSEFSVTTHESDKVAEFELNTETVQDSEDGEYVLRTGKIFEAGQYKDKNFEITPEELCEAIADFEPVDVDLEHMPTILDGKLGKLENVKLGEDGWSLIGTVRLPKWLDKQLGEAERKVSATWDRITKKLTKLALVRNPRVKDAALMSAEDNFDIVAAFMLNEFSEDLEGKDQSQIIETIKSILKEKENADFVSKTWDGKSLMQGFHDMAARSGAICVENEQKFNELKEAGFVSASESKGIQQIHDTALKSGATCSFIKERSGNAESYYSDNKKEKITMFKELKEFLVGLPDDFDIETLKKNTELSADEIKAAELAKREEAVITAEKALAEKEAALAATPAPAVEDVKSETVVEEEEVKEEVENSAEPTPSARELELEKQLTELRNKDIVRDAEKFADAEIKAERAFPAERETLVALFTQASKDDASAEVKVSFKNGEEDVELSRVDALKALYSVRKPHNFTYEEIEDFNIGILEADFGENENDSILPDPVKQAAEHAARKNKAIGR